MCWECSGTGKASCSGSFTNQGIADSSRGVCPNCGAWEYTFYDFACSTCRAFREVPYCPNCGYGYPTDHNVKDCSFCNGHGYTGCTEEPNECSKCNGEGEVTETESCPKTVPTKCSHGESSQHEYCKHGKTSEHD